MRTKIHDLLLIFSTVTCVVFAWGHGTQSLSYSVALTAAGLGFVVAYHAMRGLRQEIADLRGEGGTAN